MHRLSLLVISLFISLSPVVVQGQQATSGTETANRLTVRPPQQLPLSTQLADALDLESDSLTNAQVLARIARIYRYQSDLLMAQSEGANFEAEALLDLAMTELATLVQQPNIMDRPRFRELYRTMVSEYERVYGPSDTLTLAYGEIFQLRADMFAALNEVDEPLLEDLAPRPLTPMQTTVPMTMNRLVESSIAYLQRNPDRHINNWMARAETYLPMIEQIFAEEGVPDELKYLAMIESGLNPRARSWAQAVGMWQFIAATGRAYDLQINGWVDERMNPEKATRAAARHLRDLYKQYGDWHIALAGYNCSPRCIKRAINQSKQKGVDTPTYWDIYPYLPRETRNYVPMFIATSLVASNPQSFGLQPVQPGPQYAYHYVPILGTHALSTIAEIAGTDVNTIRALNPELRQSSLPPSTGPFYVRIPLGSYDTFMAAYADLPQDVRRPSGEYIVRKGDTLGRIAGEFSVSVADLMKKNGLRSTRLKIGQRLAVPVYESAVPEDALAETTAMTVTYRPRNTRPILSATELPAQTTTLSPTVVQTSLQSSSSNDGSSTPAPKKTTATEAPTTTRTVYRVQRGDNLNGIAKKYGVTVRDLQQWNNLSGTKIQVGQRLSLYAAASKADTPPERITYKVRRGDTLSEIATKHSTTVTNLRQWNNIQGSSIRIGQRLTIYPGQSAPQAKTVTYKVRRGDTLSNIATKHGTTVTKLKEWNSLRSSKITVGQSLKINV